jgi:hypothetical protein
MIRSSKAAVTLRMWNYLEQAEPEGWNVPSSERAAAIGESGESGCRAVRQLELVGIRSDFTPSVLTHTRYGAMVMPTSCGATPQEEIHTRLDGLPAPVRQDCREIFIFYSSKISTRQTASPSFLTHRVHDYVQQIGGLLCYFQSVTSCFHRVVDIKRLVPHMFSLMRMMGEPIGTIIH